MLFDPYIFDFSRSKVHSALKLGYPKKVCRSKQQLLLAKSDKKLYLSKLHSPSKELVNDIIHTATALAVCLFATATLIFCVASFCSGGWMLSLPITITLLGACLLAAGVALGAKFYANKIHNNTVEFCSSNVNSFFKNKNKNINCSKAMILKGYTMHI